MLVTKKHHDFVVAGMQFSIKRLQDAQHERERVLCSDIRKLEDKYLALYNKHERLMIHLGLHEHVLSGIEIRTKGGPEREIKK